jgi:hypothetical protein
MSARWNMVGGLDFVAVSDGNIPSHAPRELSATTSHERFDETTTRSCKGALSSAQRQTSDAFANDPAD